jgi:hypothetical protein
MGYNFQFLGVQNKVWIGQDLHRLVMCSCSKESMCFFSRASIFFFPCWCWSSYIFTIPSNKFDQWLVYKRIGTCYLWVNSIHDIGFLVTMGTCVKSLRNPCLNVVDISLSNWPTDLVKNWLMLLEAPTQTTFISLLVSARDLWPLWSPLVSLNLVHVLVFFRNF